MFSIPPVGVAVFVLFGVFCALLAWRFYRQSETFFAWWLAAKREGAAYQAQASDLLAKLKAAEEAVEDRGGWGRWRWIHALAATSNVEHASERLLLLVLAMGTRDGVYRMPTAHLVDLTQLSPSTVNAGLRVLADKGLIVDTGERFGSRHQHRVWRLSWVDAQEDAKEPEIAHAA